MPQTVPAHASVRANLLIFDGSCGFCTWSVATALRLRSDVTATPYQWLDDAELGRVGITRERTQREVHFVDAAGTVYRGADAVNALLASVPRLGLIVRFVRSRPALVRIEQRAYEWIAANRIAISRVLGTQRCALLPD